jgi:hypothetical protein
VNETFTHEDKSCFKKPCRNAAHWKLRLNGKEIKDTTLRIAVMRQQWHGLED